MASNHAPSSVAAAKACAKAPASVDPSDYVWGTLTPQQQQAQVAGLMHLVFTSFFPTGCGAWPRPATAGAPCIDGCSKPGLAGSQPSPLSCAPSKNCKASKSKRVAGPGSNAGRAAKRGKTADAAATACVAADDACTLLDVKDIHAMFDSQPEICTQQISEDWLSDMSTVTRQPSSATSSGTGMLRAHSPPLGRMPCASISDMTDESCLDIASSLQELLGTDSSEWNNLDVFSM